MSNDPFNLERFVDAQAAVYPNVVRELQNGRKQSHWMWFIFPQIAGLGHSSMAQLYAIQSLDEARAYLAHSVLGPRLVECTSLVNQVIGRSAEQIFGYPDWMKFHSSVTLFDAAQPSEALFRGALDKYFNGQRDEPTLQRL